MKICIHKELAERIREGCEARLNIRIRPRWFALGSVFPDCSHQRLLHMHEWSSAGPMVGRMIRRFCAKSLYSGQNLSWWRSLRLGIVMHYISDFSCYAHTSSFPGTLLEHRAYEEAQNRPGRPLRPLAVCSFFGADSSDELVGMLSQTLTQREEDSYSPANDMDYALAIGIELAYGMMRVSMGAAARTPWRFRLPLIGHRLLRRIAYI